MKREYLALRIVCSVTVALSASLGSFSLAGESGDFVYICTDAGAGGDEEWPDICRLDDGRFMCTFHAGYSHVSLPNETYPLGGRISYCLSDDEGRTWGPAQTLYDGPGDDGDGGIVQLPDGRLLCNYYYLTTVPNDIEGPGWKSNGSWYVESSDAGVNWSEPKLITPDYPSSSPIRVLSSGRLALGLYRENFRGVETPNATAAVVTSDDGGLTWNTPVEIPNGGVYMDAETDLIELTDGRLFAAQRSETPTGYWSVSSDQGDTWSDSPQPFGFMVKSPYLHRTNDGTIVMGYRGNGGEPTKMRYSRDECQTWSEEIMIEDQPGGYPSMVNLDDGSVLVAYYGYSNIRAKQFRIAESGEVEWISLQGEVTLPDGTPDAGYHTLQAWYHAGAGAWKDDGSGGLAPAADGDVVVKLDDLSNNGCDMVQSIVGGPVLATDVVNGEPVLRFNGGETIYNHSSIGDSFTIGQPNTIFVVVRVDDAENGGTVFSSVTNNGANALGVNEDGDWVLKAKDLPLVTEPVSEDLFQVHTLVYDTANSKHFIDGVLVGEGVLETALADGICLGRHIDQDYFTGDIAEILVYDELLDLFERQAIEGYLAAKYVPEPATLSLLTIGGLAVLRRRKK